MYRSSKIFFTFRFKTKTDSSRIRFSGQPLRVTTERRLLGNISPAFG
jgi:hypothetical protein